MATKVPGNNRNDIIAIVYSRYSLPSTRYRYILNKRFNRFAYK